MRKISILPVLLLAGGTLMAQNNIQSFQDLINTPASVNKTRTVDPKTAPQLLNQNEPAAAPVASVVSVYDGLLETVIGTTTYDLQTNNSVQNRLVDLGNGELAAVWTMSDENGPAFDNRGTGYNYFDGSDWADMPDERIEGKRTGWPSIVVMGNGTEAFLCHSTDATSPANVFGTRTTPGTGAWTLGAINAGDGGDDLELTWNRMVTGGTDNNTLHVIGHSEFPELMTDDNTVGYISYSRSTDGGATWDIIDSVLADIDSTHYRPFGGDGYSITADGNTVAFVCGGGERDVILMKSTDNGATWTKSIIWSFPYAKFDPTETLIDTADRVNTSDGAYSISLDDDGDAHVFFGNYYIANSELSEGTSWYPLTDGLFHWEESYGVADTANRFQMFDTLAVSVDSTFLSTISGIDDIANYFSGISSYPSSAVDANGDIYVTYSACVTTGMYEEQDEAGDEFERVYRHQYIVRSTDGGATWSDPRDLMSELIDLNSGDIFYEGVFGSIIIQDGSVFVMYQRDEVPGIHIQPADNNPHEVSENEIVVVSFGTSDFELIGLEENGAVTSAKIFPNPATNNVKVRFDLDQAQKATVSVVNMIGQTVLAQSVEAEVSNTVSMDISALNTGVYFVEIKAGNSTITEKLVIR